MEVRDIKEDGESAQHYRERKDGDTRDDPDSGSILWGSDQILEKLAALYTEDTVRRSL